MTPERRIQNEILRIFGTNPKMRLWRSNTGKARMGGGLKKAGDKFVVSKPREVSFGVPGAADLHGIIPVGGVGCFLAIEVKSPGGRQTPEQLNYEAMVLKFNGIYVLARSVEDVWAVIGDYLK